MIIAGPATAKAVCVGAGFRTTVFTMDLHREVFQYRLCALGDAAGAGNGKGLFQQTGLDFGQRTNRDFDTGYHARIVLAGSGLDLFMQGLAS
jgi:hypothetical protein